MKHFGCDNCPLAAGLVQLHPPCVCETRGTLLTAKSASPRSWLGVQQLARLYSDAKMRQVCSKVYVTLLSPDFLTNQQFILRELPPFGRSCTCWMEIYLLFCQQPGFSVAAIVSPRAETLRPAPAGITRAVPGGTLPGAGWRRRGLPGLRRLPSLSLSGLVISEKPWKAEDDVGKQLLIVKNNMVPELLDISGLRVGNLPPGPSGGALKGLMLYSRGAEL